MLRPTTKSYAGRQVDLELLKHVEAMLPTQRVTPDVAEAPRIVSGIEKAVQRYTKLFLTTVGTVRARPDEGNELLRDIALGKVQNISVLDYLYSVANANTLAALQDSDDETSIYGGIPDDERIVSTRLLGLDLVRDLSGGRVEVKISLETAAGEEYEFIIPVSAGVS